MAEMARRSNCAWLTDLPIELATEVFRKLSAKDIARIRLVDKASLAYVNTYWWSLSPLYRHRTNEFVVRLPLECHPGRYRQGREMCTSWGLSSDLFTATLDLAYVRDVLPEIRDCCGSLRIQLPWQEVTDETRQLYSEVGLIINSLPALQRLSIRGKELCNDLLKLLLDGEGRRGTLQHLEICTSAVQLAESLDLHWRSSAPQLNLNNLVSQVSHFTSLKSLTISGCGAEMAAVRSITTTDIAQLSDLTGLYLARNSSLRCLPDAIGRLTRLQALSLEHSAVSVLPDDLSRLGNLRHLNLSACPLRAMPPICSFPRLELLDLHNALKGDSPFFTGAVFNLHEALSALTALTSLRIGGNKDVIQLSSLNVLSRLARLRELDMQRLGLPAIPVAVAGLTRLTCLQLTANNIEEVPAWISHLRRLRTLDLRLNSLTGALPDALLELSALGELRLERNRFLIRTDVLRILKKRGVDVGLSG